jgi:hypothetical protein
MGWNIYRVSLRLMAPLHIGWKRSSNFQQTRPYVPAKNIWGALIARLAETDGNYAAMKTKVSAQLRFSYFYPSTKPDYVSLWPWDNEDMFNWLFMNSYVSSALNNKLADRGYLHEIEHIASRARDGSQVYLIGYVFERENIQLPWIDALNHLQLGGERSTGWGRVKIERKLQKIENNQLFGYQVDVTGDQPLLKMEKGKSILAHVAADNGLKFKGILEPMIGRDTKDTVPGKGFGAEITTRICWMPGTIFEGDDGKFLIEPEGVWIPVN